MAELSIIELFIYGLIGYSGVVMLIASAFRESPATKSQSVVRTIWILPSIICVMMLASAGQVITFDHDVTTSVLINTNTTEVWNETVIADKTISLVQPVWITLHIMLFSVMGFYFIWNILQLFTKRD